MAAFLRSLKKVICPYGKKKVRLLTQAKLSEYSGEAEVGVASACAQLEASQGLPVQQEHGEKWQEYGAASRSKSANPHPSLLPEGCYALYKQLERRSRAYSLECNCSMRSLKEVVVEHWRARF